jgi:predicted transporter
MRRLHTAGLLLWRGGVLLLTVTAAIELMRSLMRFMEVPGQVEIGAALVSAGLLFVFASLIMERVRDSRSERDWQE